MQKTFCSPSKNTGEKEKKKKKGKAFLKLFALHRNTTKK